jgi:hypothetical protein
MIRESEAIGQKVFGPPDLRQHAGYFLGTVPPTTSDDETAGFGPGSFWYISGTPERLWMNVDATEGTAVWREMPLAFARAPHVVYQEYTTVATTQTADYEDLYSHDVVNKLTVNGDVLHCHYAGVFNPSTDTKNVVVEVGSTQMSPVLTVNLIASDAWMIDMYLIRVNATNLRWALRASVPAKNVMVQSFDVPSIDATNFTVALRAWSLTTIGDIEVNSCYAMLMPADGSLGAAGFYLEFLGDTVEFLGEPLEFNP